MNQQTRDTSQLGVNTQNLPEQEGTDSQIITTDSAPLSADKRAQLDGRITVLSVSDLLGEVIRRAHEGRSVGEMFNE